MCFRGKITGRVQNVDEVAADKGRGTVTASQIDVDESFARKRDAGVTRIYQVEAFIVNRRVRNKRCGAMFSWERRRQLSQNSIIARAGSQRTLGGVIESHPVAASEIHVVLHGFDWDDVCPYGE